MAERAVDLKPQQLLRPHWVELKERIWADHLTDRLYEKAIVSKRHKDQIENKAKTSRLDGVALLLDVLLTRTWKQCVEFAVMMSETEGLEDLGGKLLRLKSNLEDSRGEVVLEVGDSKTEMKRLRAENKKLLKKTESLAKEKSAVEKREMLAVRKEKGERLLRLGYAVDKGTCSLTV
jgi:hypothetical protein